jgi:hypothetical protein
VEDIRQRIEAEVAFEKAARLYSVANKDCPKCGAAPGEWCHGKNTKYDPSVQVHIARWKST